MVNDIVIEDYNEHIAIDPGVINTLSIVRRKNNKEENIIVTTKDANLAYKKRAKRQNKMTRKFDTMIFNYLKEYEDPKQQPSSKSIDFKKFVNFKLKFFAEGVAAYMQKRVTNVKFEKYISDQKVTDSLCKSVSLK